MDAFAQKYAEFYDDNFVEKTAQCKSATHKLIYIIGQAQLKRIPMYLIVDEYDNFTNTILSLHGEKVYKAIKVGDKVLAGDPDATNPTTYYYAVKLTGMGSTAYYVKGFADGTASNVKTPTDLA